MPFRRRPGAPRMSSGPRRVLVALLEHAASVEAVRRRYGPAASCTVATDSWLVRETAAAAGLPAVLLDDLLDALAVAEANAAVQAVRQSWHADEDGDFTLLCGVSLGSLLEFELSYAVLFPLVRTLGASRRLLQEERPDLVLCDAAPDAPVWHGLAAVSRGADVPVERIVASSGQSQKEAHYWLESARRAGRRGGKVAALGRRLLGRFLTESRSEWALGRRQGTVLFNYYPALGPVIDAWGARGLGDAIRFDPAAAPSPGRALRYFRAGARVLDVTSADGGEDALGAARSIRLRWERARADAAWWRSRMLRGTDIRPALEPVLDAYVAGRIPGLATQLAGLRAAYTRGGVSCVVVPFDAPERPRLQVCAARSLGIPSVVVQHGLSVSAQLDDDKRSADHVLVWSEPVRDQLASWGVDRQRLRVVGNPVFDRYAGSGATPRPRRRSEPPTALVLTATHINFNAAKDSTISERYLRLVLDGLRRLPGRLRCVLRPHPSERTDYYRELLASWGDRVDELAADVPFERCLEESDLVISPVSTAALEAWLAGKRVIVVSDCRWGVDYPLDGRAEIPTVSAPESLAEAIVRALTVSGPDPRASRVAAYCGPSDGRSAERVVDFIDGLRQDHLAGRSRALGAV